MRTFIFAVACCAPLACGAASFEAIVSHVTDGDTVWVRPLAGGPPQNVRLEGIDAPEICQAFGVQSRDALAARLLHKRVALTTTGEDDYRRTVARIEYRHADVGAWLVSHGYAWSYRFRQSPGPYVRQEARARRRHSGLWGAGDAESPRDFRVRHGSCH